jgi:hypothetical protein
MAAEPPPDRRRPPRPVDEPTSRVVPRGRHSLSPEPVPPAEPAPESTTRVPAHDPERTAMFDQVEPARAPRPRPAGRPQRAPGAEIDPATAALPQAPRPDATATARVPTDAERTRALGRVERTAVVPVRVREPRATPPAPAGPDPTVALPRTGPAPRARRPSGAAAAPERRPSASAPTRSRPTPSPTRAEPAPRARPQSAPAAPPPLPAPTRAAARGPAEPPPADAPPAGPVGSPLPGLAWRAGLVVVSAALALLGAPAPVAAPVVVATAVVVAERVARHRRRGLLDLVLTAVAGTTAALALLGMALDVLPTGVSTAGWAVGAGLLGLVALACCARRPPVPGVPQMITRRRTRRRPTPLAVACVVAAVLVVAATLVGSALSAQATQRPPLQISAGPPVDGRVEVRLDAGDTTGVYDLVLSVDGLRTVVSAGVRLDPGQVRTVPVAVPAAPRVLVQLVAAGGTDPVRELIVADQQKG